MTRPIYAAVINCRDTLAGAAATLYFATEKLNTIGTDTPANTYFSPRLRQPVSVRRELFAAGTTRGRSTVSVGDTILANEDGALDYLDDFAFDGYTVTTYRGLPGAAFPAGYDVVWTSTMRDGESDEDDFVLRRRDQQTALDGLVQSTHFDGDNVLPAGLEGGADLEGEPKPWGGGEVRNASPPMVNSSKLVFQHHDGAVSGVATVYDRGIPLGQPDLVWEALATFDTLFGWRELVFAPEAGNWFATNNNESPRGMLSTDDGESWVGVDPQIAGEESTAFSTLERGGGYYLWGGAYLGSPRLYVSPDGINWKNPTIAVGGNDVAGAGYADFLGMWFIGGTDGSIQTSTDRLAWTTRTIGFASDMDVEGFADDGSIVVAIGDDSGVSPACAIETSANGTSWTSRTIPTNWDHIYSIVYNEPLALFVICGNNGTTSQGAVATSPDGITWTERTIANEVWFRLANLDGWGVVVVSTSDEIAWSEDGITWTQLEDHPGDSCLTVAVGNGWVMTADRTSPFTVYRSRLVGREYASEADLLDDTKAPAPGTAGHYLAGGLSRLGSSPAGVVTSDFTVEATAAERTAAQLWVKALEKFGLSNMVNVQVTDDVASWTSGGTPVVTSGIDDPIGGTSAVRIEDDDPVGAEQKHVSVTLTGDGVKVVEWIFRERDGGQSFWLYDDTAGAGVSRLSLTGFSVNGEPVISAVIGTLVDVVYVGNGYWRARALSISATAANANRLIAEGVAEGTIDIFRGRVYDETAVADAWDWMDVERADLANPAECGYWAGLEYVSASTVLSALANSIGAWWGLDRFGVLRFRVIGDPQLEANGFTFPRDIDNAAWSKVQASVTADATVAPNGVTEMDKLVEDTNPANHRVDRTLSAIYPDDGQAVISFYAAAAERTHIWAAIVAKDNSQRYVVIDLDTGLVTGGSSNGRPATEVSYMGSGIWHISITGPVLSGSTTPAVRFGLCDGPSSGAISYTGDGSSGAYFWDVTEPIDIALTITDPMVIGRVRRLPSTIPPYRHHVRYQRNYTVQDVAGLAGAVLDTRREVVARAFQEVESVDATVQTRHLLAPESEIDTYLDVRADAATEGARLQALHGVRRVRYEVTIPLSAECLCVDLGSKVRLIHSRYRLRAGRVFYVAAVEPDAANDTLRLEVWG